MPRCFSFREGSPPMVQPGEINAHGRGRPNRISSTRFTVLTWLPKSLFTQFQRAANMYFLFVSVLVCTPWSPTMWSSTVLPFACVLMWTALKDLYEDIRRRRDDDAENMRQCWRYDFSLGKFVQVRWDQVLCGDILLALQDEAFPADMGVIGASQGQAFISTANLDGESNLKERRAAAICSALMEHVPADKDEAHCPDGVEAYSKVAELLVELVLKQGLEAKFLVSPRVGLRDMNGLVTFTSASPAVASTLVSRHIEQPCTLRYDNFVPRGCVLRNTPWLVAVAVYVGDQTQARLSVMEAKSKISNLQVHLNQCVKGLVCTLIVFCLYAAIMASALGMGRGVVTGRGVVDFPEAFVKYWIILYQIVPISLYVCFEVVKLILGFDINVDPQMVDPDTGKAALARTADLVEELGQVSHVFSDKTGTLTRNEMRFARCCVGGLDLGDFRPEPVQRMESTDSSNIYEEVVAATTNVASGTVAAQRTLRDTSMPCCQEMRRFFLFLAVCHDAQVEMGRDGEPRFSGSSPDEVAFLQAAHEVGVSLRSRRACPSHSSGAVLEIEGPEGNQTLTVLCQVPFSSERKRMTVVCELNGEYLCITKGADNVMGPLCESGFLGDSVLGQLEAYAMLGLRTLVIAWKSVDGSTVLEWRRRFEAARNTLEDRDKKISECAAEMEHSLNLCGISAIEDRLQEGVPGAISMLTEMGILVWVLTGDKTETAVEIARSCGLLSDEMALVTLVEASSRDDAAKMLRGGAELLSRSGNGALVFDGTLAKYALEDPQARLLLFDLALASRACICCRLTPQQKQMLVKMVRERDSSKITLAIGDGANDVAMLQAAHVGVAVRGKEGSQAVQASEIAISQFRFLVPLLHCHGRRAYRRVSVFLCYYVYKHVVLAVGDMCWAHQSRFAGEIAYPEWLSSAYSLFFTSLPVIVIVGFDQDLTNVVALSHPELYQEGLQRMHFNAVIFVHWVVSGIWHGSLAWLVPSLVLGAAEADTQDWGGTFWMSSVTAFSLVIIFVNLKLWLVAMNPLALKTLVVLLLSFFLYSCTVLILGHSLLGKHLQWQIEGVPLQVLSRDGAVEALLLAPLALLADCSAVCARMYFKPTPLEKVRWRRWTRRPSKSKVAPD